MTTDPIYLRPIQIEAMSTPDNRPAILPDHEQPGYQRIISRFEEQNAEYIAVQRRLLAGSRREFWNKVAIWVLIGAIAPIAIAVFIVLPCYLTITLVIKVVGHILAS